MDANMNVGPQEPCSLHRDRKNVDENAEARHGRELMAGALCTPQPHHDPDQEETTEEDARLGEHLER